METKIKERKKILIADSSNTKRLMVKKWLKDTYDIIEADSGSEIVSLCESNEIYLAIIAKDLQGCDGFEAAAGLRKKYDKNKLPVILSTTHKNRKDILKALDVGINDYIIKPFTEELLMLKIHKLELDIPAHDVKMSETLSRKLFFNGIPDFQLALAINTCSETITKEKGDIICKQDEENFDLFVLMEGECDVIFDDNKVSKIQAVDTIGEMGFIAKKKRSATVKATEPCNLIVFKKDMFDKFLNEDRVIYEIICENVIQILSNRITKSNEMIGWLLWS